MKIYRFFALVFVAVVWLLFVSAERSRADSANVAASQGVLERFIGKRAANFSLRTIPAENGLPVYEYEVKHGVVFVGGSSGVALCRGAYDYLKSHGYAFCAWGGNTLTFPTHFADEPLKRVVSPFQFNQAYNVCVYGYTTPFWHWADWRREIDWLALHGYNMAITMEGQEGVWDRIWKRHGLTDNDLKDFYSGPAFLTWFRMGNAYGYMGPLPKSWMESHVVLQHQILNSMNELGIEPIVPAFSGFVPPAFARINPTVHLDVHRGWSGFPQENATYALGLSSPEYSQLMNEYVKAYEQEYGQQRYFLIDCFNEIDVPVSNDRETRLGQLASYGENVYQSLIKAEPNATWVMQGWMFYNSSNFWDPESTKALLSKIPDDRMIIIDLCNEAFHGWQRLAAFYGKQWILSYIPTFGGTDTVFGPLDRYALEPAQALANPNKGKLIGLSRSEEGFENNDISYELLSDAGWSRDAIDLKRWIPLYCRARYGQKDAQAEHAWGDFLEELYRYYYMNSRNGYQLLPPRFDKDKYNPYLADSVAQYLAASNKLGCNRLYIDDAIELTTQVVASRIDMRLQDALHAADAKNWPLCSGCVADAVDAMHRLDLLVAAHPTRNLDLWDNQARSWGTNSAEQDLYVQNARLILTRWGGNLDDYAARNWSGLIGDYYAGRITAYFDALKSGQPFRQREWEDRWIMSTRTPPAKISKHPIDDAKALLETTSSWTAQYYFGPDAVNGRVIQIGRWQPSQLSTNEVALEWPVGDDVVKAGTFDIFFLYQSGRNALNIKSVQLVDLQSKAVLADDVHSGHTGNDDSENRYHLNISRSGTSHGYLLRALVSGDGDGDSSGCVFGFIPEAPAPRH